MISKTVTIRIHKCVKSIDNCSQLESFLIDMRQVASTQEI